MIKHGTVLKSNIYEKINVDKYEEEYQSSRNKIEQGYENATFLSLIQIPVA